MLLAFMIAAAVGAANAPSVTPDFHGRLAEVRGFSAEEGDSVWPGYGTAPFGFLLIEGDKENLLCHSAAPQGFSDAGTDSKTGCPLVIRPRSGFPDTLLAAMPLFGPPSVIVMGTPASTGRSEPDWVRTILHEHFHQWQNALPDYYPRTLALGLAGGDQTGMWMLNYPFPYDRKDIVAAHASASRALAEAVDARLTPAFYPKFDAYMARRADFERSAGSTAWRYAELQLWQEGVARWTEIALGKRYPDSAVRGSAAKLEDATLASLRSPDIAGQKREFAYSFGAGEAMLLDACGSGWRRGYPSTLQLGTLLMEARRTCGRQH